MFKYINPFNIYILLWLGYTLCSNLYPGTSLSQMSLLLIMIISIYYTFKANVRYRLPKYFKALNILLIMFTIYGLLYFMFGEKHIITEGIYFEVPKIEYLKNIYMSMLPIYPFFVFSRKGYITEPKIMFLSLIFIVISIFLYYWKWYEFMYADMYGRTEMTNNMGYRFVALFPLLFYWRKHSIIQYLLGTLIMAFIFMSMKRGAILVATFCMIYFFYNTVKYASGARKIIIISLILGLIVGAVYYIGDMLLSSDYLQKRIYDTLEGNASNRQDMYPMIMEHFMHKASILEVFLGGGVNTTIEVVNNYAHNDWFEILLNQGILGLIIYCFYWKCLYRTWKMLKREDLIKMTIGMFIIVYFVASMFSMSYAAMNISATICLGHCLSKIKLSK